MNEDGYTLVETLAALAMLGLALGGLGQALHLIGKGQTSATKILAEEMAVGRAGRSLDVLLADAGPFRSIDNGTLVGSSLSFSFACSGATRCDAVVENTSQGATLRAKGASGSVTVNRLPGPLHFLYISDRTHGAVWPPSMKQAERLKVLAIVRGHGGAAMPIATVRLWKDEARTCEFDPIARDCRSSAP